MSNSQSNKVKDKLGDSGLKSSQKKTEKSKGRNKKKHLKKEIGAPVLKEQSTMVPSRRLRGSTMANGTPLGGLGGAPVKLMVPWCELQGSASF
jgi:hypothetical protein